MRLKHKEMLMGNTDIIACSNLLSSLYESYSRGLRSRVAEGRMTSRTRNAKLERARQNIMDIINEIKYK